MIRPRIIPCLLLRGKGLVKGIQFQNHTYVGDPINAIRIFNDKEVDELIFLDITATQERRIPPLDLIQTISDQCLMPFAVGGGITTIGEARDILNRGAEKVCLNTATIEHPELITALSETFGTQSVVVSIDVKKNGQGQYQTFTRCGSKPVSESPVELAIRMEQLGAGELLVNSIDRDGTQTGYDTELIREVADAVSVPVIACGGAGSLRHLSDGLSLGHASAVAAGSLFVFTGRRRAVLINFPSKNERENLYQAVGVQGEESL